MGCATLPENRAEPTYALVPKQDSRIRKGITTLRADNKIGKDDALFVLLDDGVDALAARLALISSAEQSIDLQYYLYHSDLSGSIMTSSLWKAANRGVRVRLLVDDMDLAGKDKGMAILSSHPNFSIRIFNPFTRGKIRATQFVTQFGDITRRMHNKSITVDGSISILGGRNIGDVYFGADPDVAFGDLDVIVSGKSVQEVSGSFDKYWNCEVSYPVELLTEYRGTEKDFEDVNKTIEKFRTENRESKYAVALRDSRILDLVDRRSKKIYKGKSVVLYDDPRKIVSDRSKGEYKLSVKLEPYFNKISKELVIVSPYFVPKSEGVDYLTGLVKKGVKVKILTNSLMSNDVKIVHSGYSRYRKDLLEGGVELYEADRNAANGEDVKKLKLHKKRSGVGSSSASLHAKFFVIDREETFIGSLNLDPRSVHENTEIGVVIVSPEMANDIASNFDENICKIAYKLTLEDGDIVWTRQVEGEEKVFHKEPGSSWWDRFLVSLMRLLPVESEL